MIDQIDVYSVSIPMRRPFSHAAKARHSSDSVLLCVRVGEARGFGEGAPRSYVTGETTEGGVAALARADIMELGRRIDWESFEGVVESLVALDLPKLLSLDGRRSPAAACALETAILDVAGRMHGRPMSDAFKLAGLGGDMVLSVPRAVTPSLTIDLSTSPDEVMRREPGLAAGAVRHVKVKVGGDAVQGVARLRRLRELIGDEIAISLDANCAWELRQTLTCCAALRDLSVAWIEEPFAPRDWGALRRLREQGGIAVMLDESIVDDNDLLSAIDASACDLINVRVSKCGGPLRAARLADAAIRRRLGFQIGVQVGEVGPLWAAGRALATSLQHFRTCEVGRVDEWFPANVTEPPFPIDRVTYMAPPLQGPGHGIVPGPAIWAHARRRFSHVLSSKYYDVSHSEIGHPTATTFGAAGQ
jgi:L-Ala-D/L-Glu epimerase